MELNNLDVTHLVSLLESRLNELLNTIDEYRDDIDRIVTHSGLPENSCIKLKERCDKCIKEKNIIEELINFYEENIFPL